MGLKAYIARRIVYMIILIFLVATVNFLLFNLMPGTTLSKYVAQLGGVAMTEERLQQLKESYGLDQPIHVRYLLYIRNMVTWNFGYSYETRNYVQDDILMVLPNTLILMGISELGAMLVGILLGVIAAYKRGSSLDTFLITTSLATYSVPVFWIGWLVLSAFALNLGWFPVGGIVPQSWAFNPPSSMLEYISGRLYMLTLPAFTLFIFLFGGWILLTRATVLETITEDYVTTARAKGLPERTVLFKHVLKNASLPLITSAALTFGFLISGAIITETVFSYGGMGLMIWAAIATTDVPVMQAFFFVIALLVVVANFVADMLYGVIDPRIKYG
ncbi:MAG: ABC transporter permease [Candidatus Bathyarchaeota archaeon]|nr:MAG: ABC transporter permease [Candidatus Bathyarchaeota archaeon]